MASETKDERDERKPDLGSQRLKDALKHPLRAKMFAELGRRSASPPELADMLGQPLPVVKYHYGVLETRGGIPSSPDADNPQP